MRLFRNQLARKGPVPALRWSQAFSHVYQSHLDPHRVLDGGSFLWNIGIC
jgi:hypothetical protein